MYRCFMLLIGSNSLYINSTSKSWQKEKKKKKKGRVKKHIFFNKFD